jgi:hypothetical protein
MQEANINITLRGDYSGSNSPVEGSFCGSTLHRCGSNFGSQGKEKGTSNHSQATFFILKERRERKHQLKISMSTSMQESNA